MSSLYLHIPFCEHKCIYCDFYSLAPTEERMDGDVMMGAFVERLLREIDLQAEREPGLGEVTTVFFGGGTPSLMTPAHCEAILGRLAGRYSIARDAEVTMEANPGTVSEDRLRSFRTLGVNRISFGVQSFHDDELKFLTRIHSAEQARASVRAARKAGFTNLNLDLMFALPGHTPDRWMATLNDALALEPDHLSCYSLIVEPNTPLFRLVESGQVTTLDTETDAALYEATLDTMARAGFEQYEVSNFSRPGMRCRHNDNYWNHGAYLGFGPSAHSFRTPRRSWNVANLSTYMATLDEGRLPVAGGEDLRPEQMMTEALFLGLRSDGLDVPAFDRTYGGSFIARHRDRVDDLVREGLATVAGGVFRLTSRGYLLCDEICASFDVGTASTSP